MKIGIDMDGVIIDTIGFIAEELSKVLGCRITPEDIVHRLDKIDGADSLFLERGEYLLCSGKPVDKAVEVINELSRSHEIYIISARFMLFYEATLNWLQNHGIQAREVIFTEGRSKAGICTNRGIELFIEDNIQNALEISSVGTRVILLSTDYNTDERARDILHCKNWEEISVLVKSFETGRCTLEAIS